MLNKVMIIGHLGQDPKIINTSNGAKLATFNIATSESWKDKNTGEKKEITEWHNIVITSSSLAKIAEKYLTKGSKVYIDGKLKTRSYEDKSGDKKYITEVIVGGYNSELKILSIKNNRDNEQIATETINEEVEDFDFEDGIPF